MKKLLVVLAVVVTTFSCTPDDQCGTITGWDIDYNGDYVIYVDNVKHRVIASTWYAAEVGNTICIEY